MRYLLFNVILILTSALCAQEGELDLSFNGNGIFIHETRNVDEEVSDMVLKPDGSILMAAPARTSNSNDHTTLLQLDAYGNPDPRFGNQGFAITNFGSDVSYGRAIQVQSDGKILLAGEAEWNTQKGIGLQRLLSNGQPDYSFGDSSRVLFPVNGFNPIFHFIGIQPSGKIVVAGRINLSGTRAIAVRFHPNGSPDYSYGDSAVASTASHAQSLIPEQYIMQPDGSITGAGYAYQSGEESFALVQITADGMPDATFGSTGILLLNWSGRARSYALARQSDGKLVIGGYLEVNNDHHFALARIHPNGSPDQSFGQNGRTSVPLLSDDAEIYALEILANGKILAAGQVRGIWNRDFAAARFTTSGNLDNSFSLDGYMTKNIGNGNDYLRTALLQPNGRLVVAGSCYFTYNQTSGYASYDIAVARILGGPGNFALEDFYTSGVDLFPNPARHQVELHLPGQNFSGKVEMLDLNGKMIWQEPVSENSMRVNVSQWPRGLYLVQLRNPEGRVLARSKLMLQ